MKILIYGYGGHALFMKYAILHSKNRDINWSIILPSYHHVDDFRDLLGTEQVLYVQEKMNHVMKEKRSPLSIFKDYPDSIYKDLASDKIGLTKMDKDFQIKYVCSIYLIYKEFIDKIKPDVVFFPTIQDSEAKILYNICKEFDLETVFYTHARNFGVSFFSQTYYEDLPCYAWLNAPAQEDVKRAREFVNQFKKEFIKPKADIYEPAPDEVIDNFKASFPERTSSYISSILKNKEPYNVSQPSVSIRLKSNLLPITKWVWSVKGVLARKYFDIQDIKQVPEKFIYYPLQVTPESSINIPAPFFVDQLRAVDLIRYGMPSDHVLVVKEHPAMLGSRPLSLFKELKKRAGVILATPDISSIHLIQRAALTVSVTGTSCLESFLMGKPSMPLGRSFFSSWIHQAKSIDLRSEILKAISENEVKSPRIIDNVARLFSVSSDFVIFCPTTNYLDSRYVMNKRNIQVFLDSLFEHIQKVKQCTNLKRK